MIVRKLFLKTSSGIIVSLIYSFSYLIIYFCNSNKMERVMFKIEGKHIRKLIIAIIVSVLIPQPLLPQETDNDGTNDPENYIELNEKEKPVSYTHLRAHE